MRFAMDPKGLPDKCDGCGAKFDLEHSLHCKTGGLIHGRHDDLSRELMSLAAFAVGERNVRAEPLINPGSSAALKSNGNDSTVDQPDELRGDVLIRGVFQSNTDCVVDVRISNTDAPSYRNRKPEKVLESQEKEKKAKYAEPCFRQRRTFTPFVVSTDGLLGREAKNLLKRISLLLVEKWQKPYSVVAGIVRSRISIAIIRATNRCIRGSRISYRSISKQIQWEDGSGTGLYRIDSS